MKEIELIGKRKAREKHFLKQNGVIEAQVFDEDIHFLKNGIYEEIDNTLIDKGDCYTNKNNAYEVKLYKNTSDNLMEVSIDDNFIKTRILNPNLSELTENVMESKLHKNVCYSNILDNIDLEYNVLPTKVKEAIILKNKNVCTEKLVFSIETNMKLSLLENKKIIAEKDGVQIFEFDAPYMIDNEFKVNNNVFYELTECDCDKYSLKIKIDEDWLKDENTKYPVMIDPTITNYGQNNSVYDTQISPGDENEDCHGTAFRLRVGMIETIDGYEPMRALFKFSLPTIGTGSQIISAEVRLVGYPSSDGYGNYDMLTIHQITSDWNESSAIWNNMHDKYNSKVEGIMEARCSYFEDENVVHPITNYADITRLVRKWYTGTPNYGIMLKQNEEKYNPDFIAQFYSKDNDVIGGNPKPVLVITYRNQNGIENYMDYQEQLFSEGTAYINNYNGNLTTIFSVGQTISGKFPVKLNLIYNTNDVVLKNDYGYGLGYKLNLHQTIKERTIDDKIYLEYCDEDGTLHYFLNQKTTFGDEGYNTTNTGNVYYDEDGLDMIITKNSNDYILKDKNGSEMKFIKKENIAYLSEISDVSDNKVTITYNDNCKIIKVVDANNFEINITYYDNEITIMSPDETVYLNYLNNKLLNINSLLGITRFEYNSKNIISKIIDINGLQKQYEYYEQNPYKVKRVSEYGTEGTLGEYYDIIYGFDSTTITDSKGNAKNVIFNSQGSIVSISGLKSKDDINNAYGISQTNGTNDGTNPGYNNKLMRTEIPLKYIKNLLLNTSFEQTLNCWSSDISSSENFQVLTSEEFANTGEKSLKIYNGEYDNKIILYTGTADVVRGNYYTFSAYVKNTNNVRLQFKYEDNNNHIVETYSEIIEPSEDFEKYDVTTYYPLDAKSDLLIGINVIGVGNTYIDDVQLEKGEVANNYNLLENSDFSYGYSDWNLSVCNNQTGEELSTNDSFEIVTLDNGVKALKTKLNPVHTTNMEKKFNISGKGGDTFNISFWYKNEGINSNLSEYYGSRVFIIFKYVDSEESGGCVLPSPILNINDEAWQYVSNDFVAERDYTSITLLISHEYTANNFYISNMSLFKDVKNVYYEYDDNGNVILENNSENNSDKFNYDKNNQLIQMINPKGKRFTFEYDNIITDRVINGISDMGISNQIKYDNNNPVATIIKKNNIIGNVTDGLYKIRLKGTNNYLQNIANKISVTDEDYNHSLWELKKDGEYFKISHFIINDKYFTIIDNFVLLTSYNNDKSLFKLQKNKNGSYYIKLKLEDKYLKITDSGLEAADLIEDDFRFEFYFETIDSDLFIENTAKYTEDGRFIKSISDPFGNVSLYEMDELTGLIRSETDSKGNVIYYTYSDKNELTKVSKGRRKVEYKYNDKNLLSKITYGTKEYNFIYDEFLNIKNIKIGEDVNLVSNYYDQSDCLTSSVYGNGDSIDYEYDEFNRLKKATKIDDIYNYKYNNNGNLAKIISNNAIIKYSYNLSGKLSEYRFNDFKIKYNYDSNDNVIGIKYNMNNLSNEITNNFNDDDLIISTLFDNNKIDYSYDTIGRIKSSKINDAYETNYEYLKNGKNTSAMIKSLTAGTDKFLYKYDSLNNMTHIYKNGNIVNKYYYDNFNQLIKEINYEDKTITKYKYDNVGNILFERVYNIETYEFINQNTYKYNNEAWEDQLTEFNGHEISYDEIGNPLSIGNNIYLNWTNGRELKSYNDGSNNITYKYDDNGIRTSKIINGIETKYYLDGNDIIFEKSGDNVLYYLRSNIDDLIGFKYNDDIYYYMKNSKDDIVGILDCNFNVVARYKYDSWGKMISITDENDNDVSTDISHIANINPFRYRSFYYDKETKLYYLNERYYNPNWRRFINADIGISDIGNLDGNNMYQYALNNPINYADENGNWPKWKIKSALKVITAAAVIVTCAVVTVATGGSSSGVTGYIASSALKFAIGGTIIGAAYGATKSVIKNKKKRKSNNGSFKAAITGGSDGAMWGSIVGSIAGIGYGITRTAIAASKWYKGSFDNGYYSMKYHYQKHVIDDGFSKGNNIVKYTNDAISFSNSNRSVIKYTFDYKHKNAIWGVRDYLGKGGNFMSDGKIIRFWYKLK